VANVDKLSDDITRALTGSLLRVQNLVKAVAMFAGVVGVATFLTGLQVFDGDGRALWLTIGLVLCAIPVGAAFIGWFMVRGARVAAPALVDNVRSLLKTSRDQAAVLIDHDSGRALGVSAKSLSGLRSELAARRKELPALFTGVRALTSVPGLAAVAVLGTMLVGITGTVLLIGWLID
jgi:hypothetical protein